MSEQVQIWQEKKNTHSQNANSRCTVPELNTGTNTQFWGQRGFESLKEQERKSFWKSDFSHLKGVRLQPVLWFA